MVSVKVDGVSSRTTVGDLEYLFEKYVNVVQFLFNIILSFIGMEESGISIFQRRNTARRTGGLPLSGSLTSK